MKITDVETIPINPRLAARHADQKPRFSGIDTQTIFKVTCDNGIVGYGDSRGHVSLAEATIQSLVGQTPFNYLMANLATGLMGALYDAMGKHLEIPAYKLMGQKVRDRVPVAAWCRPASPEDLASDVQRAAAEGYMTFKLHTCDYYDVLEQVRAVEEILHGCADLYMIGENGFAQSFSRGFACAEANLSTVLQLTGGTLCKAMALHMCAVIPNVSHTTNLDDQYDEDVTGGRIEVAEGSSPVPEGPGLGVEVDEAELARIAQNPITVIPRHIGALHLPGGHTYYTRGFPSVERLTGFPEGNIRGIRLEVIEDDGGDAFQQRYDQLESGPVME
jgi:L-alanine-DL-glutamate epimerase-like enolase superfamily enzyme